MQDIDLYI